MAAMLLFLFIRGALLFRLIAWGIVVAILYTGVFLLLHPKPTFPKGTEPHHVQHTHSHPASFVRR